MCTEEGGCRGCDDKQGDEGVLEGVGRGEAVSEGGGGRYGVGECFGGIDGEGEAARGMG